MRSRVLLVVGALLTGASLWLVLTSRSWEAADQRAGVAGMFIGLAALGLSLVQVRGSTPDGAPAVDLEVLVAELAETVTVQWQREEEIRRVHDPYPLPVRWRNADEHLMDHWRNIRRGKLDGEADDEPIDLAGRLDGIEATFSQVASRRLVILGRGGAGKTIFGVRFVLDRLKSREPTDPVPVLFPMASWNPSRLPLVGFLAQSLTRNYPALRVPVRDGKSAAVCLLETNRVLPVLDGFDEISAGLRANAIRQINRALGQPHASVVVTSRPGEYEAAVLEAGHIRGAAVVQLADLDVDDLADYLPCTTKRTDPREERKWDPVLQCLCGPRDNDDAEVLRRVLGTPLMVSLARAIYSDTDRDPADLLKIGVSTVAPWPGGTPISADGGLAARTRKGGLPVRQEWLEEHLLGEYIPALYSHPPYHEGAVVYRTWDERDAERWLIFLARQVRYRGIESEERADIRNRTTELAWWRLRQAVPWEQPFMVGLPGLIAALGTWLVTRPSGGTAIATAAALVVGFFSILTSALLSTREVAPVQAQVRFRGVLLPALMVGLAAGPPSGLVLGLGVSIGAGFAAGLRTLIGVGVGLGLGMFLGFLTNAVLSSPVDIDRVTSPGFVLTGDRTTTLVRLPLIALSAGLGVGVAVGTWQGGVPGVVTGAVVALGTGLATAITSAWLRFRVAHVWLALTGRLPWPLMTFLEDAHQRGALRQSGAVYQFRHARLQYHLAQLSLR